MLIKNTIVWKAAETEVRLLVMMSVEIKTQNPS